MNPFGPPLIFLLQEDVKEVLKVVQIITISGRTIKKKAQATPHYAENAIQKINDLLAMLPQQEVLFAPDGPGLCNSQFGLSSMLCPGICLQSWKVILSLAPACRWRRRKKYARPGSSLPW